MFSAALERVEKLIADDEAARQREVQSEADSLEEREKADIAHASALAEMRRRVHRSTPVFVRDFLVNWWSRRWSTPSCTTARARIPGRSASAWSTRWCGASDR